MKIIVTGGTGFIGSYVVEELASRGHDVYVADRTLKRDILNKDKCFELDVTNNKRVFDLVKSIQPDVVIHLAGILGTSETWSHVHQAVDSNINGAINVFEACGKLGVNVLTVDVGSRWLSPYTISKRCAAEFAFAYGKKYGHKVGVLRIFNVYGPRQSTKIIKIVPKFIEMALKNATLEVWGNKKADLVHAKDVARAFANAAENLDKINQIDGILIGSGDQKTVYQVAEYIRDQIGQGTVKQMDARLGEEGVDAGFMENNLAMELLGWKPEIPFEQGMKETLDFYKRNFYATKSC